MNYPKKTTFQSVPIAALCLYNIQRENHFFFLNLSVFVIIHPYIIQSPFCISILCICTLYDTGVCGYKMTSIFICFCMCTFVLHKCKCTLDWLHFRESGQPEAESLDTTDQASVTALVNKIQQKYKKVTYIEYFNIIFVFHSKHAILSMYINILANKTGIATINRD